jgi:hypothetical protein
VQRAREQEQRDQKRIRSAWSLMNASLKDSRMTKLGTLSKLYDCAKHASARPHKQQYPEGSRVVVVQLPVVVLLPRRVPRLHQCMPAMAEEPLLCVWLYSFISEQAVGTVCVHHAHGYDAGTGKDTGSLMSFATVVAEAIDDLVVA